MFEGPGRFPAEEVGFEARVEDTAVETEGRVKRGAHVANGMQFGPDGAGAEGVFVVVEEDAAILVLGGRGVGAEGGEGGLGGEHAAAHGGVGAFDFWHVEEAGGVADEGPSWEGAFGDGLEAAFVEGSCAVGDAFAAFKDGFVEGVMFKLLELAVRGEPRVWIVEADNEAERDKVGPEVVEPAAAIGRGWKRVAHCVNYFTFAEVFRRHLPDFFEAEAIGLRLRVSPQVKFLDDLLCETTVAAFGEESNAGVKFHSSLEGGFGLAIAAKAEIVGCHSLY